ncbi:hypothetical protein JOQ06_024056 [Pogonophryne albipinna]|uniref:Uncharacterized protein n=1 Tax=Pogonophryne albipinna TaxID=1090488 RepID=A0AAD6BJV5_9TELE|nr:hypothetical protein JOQ06_024056 [Pogonophryne albipinna]
MNGSNYPTHQKMFPSVVFRHGECDGGSSRPLRCGGSFYIRLLVSDTHLREEDKEVFHHHDSPKVTFVLHRMVKGANATILLTCTISMALSALIAYVGCRSLPGCRCYDARTGLETLVPQCDPGDTEMACRWQAVSDGVLLSSRADDRLFNSPAPLPDRGPAEDGEGPSKVPPYSRLT